MPAKLPSSSLRAFVNGFCPPTRSGIAVSEFLVPTASKSCFASGQAGRGVSTETRQASALNKPLAIAEIDSHQETGFPVTLTKTRDRGIWIRRLDPYLPLELRSRGWLENLADFEGVRPIESVPKLLQEAQPYFRLGLLSYLALHEGRRTAVLWLIKELLACKRNTKQLPSLTQKMWRNITSLDEFTAKFPRPFGKEDIFKRPAPTLDEITELKEPQGKGLGLSSIWIAVGQIFQCAAHMILEAEHREPKEQQDIMSTALQVLAHMHHYNAIPSGIYDYGAAKEYQVYSKPPTLYILRSRIVVALSDALWRAEEKRVIAEAASVGAKYVYKGHELPGAEAQPRVNPLTIGTWMEFILWACVEGNWVTEAARIVSEMSARKSTRPWSVANWNTISESISKRLPGDQEWNLDQMKWFASYQEGYNLEPPLFTFDDRTVSSEVVAATTDGVLSIMEMRRYGSNMTWTTLRNYIAHCKILLDRQPHDLNPTFWNAIIVRLIEAGGSLLEERPALLSGILDLAPHVQRIKYMVHDEDSGSAGREQTEQIHSAASFGILHHTLKNYIHQGNIEGALMTFRRLQKCADENRTSLIRSTTTGRADLVISELDATEVEERIDIAASDMAIPENILAAFLDLITNAKLLNLGRWLIYSKDVDGPVIPFASFRSPILQPALLRFAMVTADSNLLVRVLKQLGAQTEALSDETLRSILHCQVVLRKWPKITEMLDYFKTDRRIYLDAYDLMVFASQIVRQESVNSDIPGMALSRTCQREILEDIIRGRYTPPPDRSKPPDYSHARRVNQVNRILAAVPGRLAEIAVPFVQQSGQAHASTEIPAEAFNVLLEAVVETHGVEAGKILFDQWCRVPPSLERNTGAAIHGTGAGVTLSRTRTTPSESLIPFKLQDQQAEEKVVTPNRQTIRIILRPILQPHEPEHEPESLSALTAPVDSDSKVISTAQALDSKFTIPEMKKADPTDPIIKWAVDMYRHLGMTEEEIYRAIPGSIPKPKAKRVPKVID